MTIPKPRPSGHHAYIGAQTDADSAADSDTDNLRHQQFPTTQPFLDDVAGLLQYRDNLFIVSVRVLDPVEVPTCREGAAGPGQYHNARFRVAVDHRPKIGQSLMHLGIRRIQLLGFAQSDPENARIATFKYHVWKRGIIHDQSFSFELGVLSYEWIRPTQNSELKTENLPKTRG